MTKNKVNDVSEKDIYRLWWEYLKRSEHYKEYCDIEPYPIKIVEKADKYIAVVMNPKTKKLSPKTISDEQFYLIWNMQRNWDTFGNIFKTKFDDWWKKRKIPNKELPVLPLNDPDICTKLPLFVEMNNELKKSKAKYPSPDQVLAQLIKSEPNYIFLAVPMVGNVTTEEISTQIASIRLEYRNEPIYRLADYLYKRFKRPISRVRFDELKRYLRVYDFKQDGLTMKQIIAEIDPDHKGFDVDVVRSFRSHLQKAKKLIANVEQGIFPEEPIIVTDEYAAALKKSNSATTKKRKVMIDDV